MSSRDINIRYTNKRDSTLEERLAKTPTLELRKGLFI